MEDLDDLYLFARVAEAGGFTAAERATGIPKSRLSRRVAALEQKLDVRLIQRSAHSFAVTSVGEVVYRHARQMIGEAEAAEAAAREVMSEPSGVVRISSSLMMGELVLGGILAEFAALYPKVRISMSLTDRFVDLTAERFDLAIRASARPLVDSDLVARRIKEAQMIVIASPDYLARHGTPKTPADLVKFDCLGYGTVDTVRKWFFHDPKGKDVEIAIEARFMVDNLVSLAHAAVAGLGLVQVPDYTAHRELANGTLVKVLSEWESPPSPVYAVYPSRRGVTSAVRALIDFLQDRLGTMERPGMINPASATNVAARPTA